MKSSPTYLTRQIKCVDDTLLWADNIDQAFWQTVQWLDTCGRNGITQNPDKFVFGKDTVEFAGFEISLTLVKPCSNVLYSIKDFSTPRYVTDIRSWFGLVNQVVYAFGVADHMRPLCDLMKPDQPFAWTAHLDYLFRKSKIVIIDQIEQGENPWTTWKALNRLRTQVGRSRVNMLKWGFSNEPETCDCGIRQTMQHLLVCPMMDTACSPQDLTTANDIAIGCARHWEDTI